MSGQWEVVGKKNKGAKGAPAKKKPNANGPKVEDVRKLQGFFGVLMCAKVKALEVFFNDEWV